MDSDDEDILQHEESERARARFHSFVKRHKGYPVRLYEREEHDWLQRWLSSGCGLSRQGHTARDDPPARRGVTYRLLRFCDSVARFHKGSLDLAGRHERRYRALRRRWDEFVHEFALLADRATETQQPILDRAGQPIMLDNETPFTECVLSVDPPEMLDEFEEKWKVKVQHISSMRKLLDDVNQCLEECPDPKFQELCLLDLPPELLHEIMGFAGVDGARRLGSTCRDLRTISLSYIYKERKLHVKFNPRWSDIAHAQGTEVHEYVRGLANTARDEFLREAHFLQSRPDILRSIESLFINGWDDRYFEMAGWEPFDDNVVDFLLPMAIHVHDIISESPNIKLFAMGSFLVTQIMRKRILSLPKLHHLKLIGCKVTGEPLLSDVSSAVPNFTLRIMDPLDRSAWTFLSSMPHLRWLSLSLGGKVARMLPPQEVSSHWNPFCTLEKAHIDGLRPVEWVDFIALIEQAAALTDRRLRLTHFKLSATFGISDFVFLDLLDALHGAPMQCFVVDGTRYAPPDLLARIGDAFPALRSLTLTYRDSDRQAKSGGARWPAPTWAYARALAPLRALRHFGWNLDVPPCASPAVMQCFEDGFAENWWEREDEGGLDDAEAVARLFGACVPSLESMVFLVNGMPFRCFRFRRGPGGAVAAEATHPTNYFTKHDPSIFMPWSLLPRTSHDSQ